MSRIERIKISMVFVAISIFAGIIIHLVGLTLDTSVIIAIVTLSHLELAYELKWSDLK